MSHGKQLLLLSLGVAVLATLIGALLWMFFSSGDLGQQSAADISLLLEQGRFQEALGEMPNMAPDDPDRRHLAQLMTARALPDARFQFQRQGEPPSGLFGLRSPEIQNMVLTNDDNYRLRIAMPANGAPNYLYVFQEDHDGKLHGLFPNPIYSDIANPVAPGRTVQIPQSDADWLFYLVTPMSDDPGPVFETMYVVASPWRAKDLDRFFKKDSQKGAKMTQEALIASFKERIRLREAAGIDAVYVETFTFNHAGQ